MQQTIQKYDNIVFNIVYNSLSCVLFAVKQNVCNNVDMAQYQLEQNILNNKCNGEILPETNIINQDEWKIGWLKNGEFECDNNILFRKDVIENGHNNHDGNESDDDEHVNTAQINDLLNSAHSDIPNGVLYIHNDVDFQSVVESKSDEAQLDIHLTNGTCDTESQVPINSDDEVLKQSYPDTDSEKSLIYSLKNTKCDSLSNSVNLKTTKNNENSNFINGNNVGSNHDKNEGHMFDFFNGVLKINEFIRAALSPTNDHHDHDDFHNQQETLKRIPLFFTEDELMHVHSAEHKKLLIQLFEITLGVMMCDTNGDDSSKSNWLFYQFCTL